MLDFFREILHGTFSSIFTDVLINWPIGTVRWLVARMVLGRKKELLFFVSDTSRWNGLIFTFLLIAGINWLMCQGSEEVTVQLPF